MCLNWIGKHCNCIIGKVEVTDIQSSDRQLVTGNFRRKYHRDEGRCVSGMDRQTLELHYRKRRSNRYSIKCLTVNNKELP